MAIFSNEEIKIIQSKLNNSPRINANLKSLKRCLINHSSTMHLEIGSIHT